MTTTRETHSVKALKTLEILGTAPAAWKQADIKWVQEEREVPGFVTCSDCAGTKWVRLDAEGKPLPVPAATGYFNCPRQEYARLAMDEEKVRRGYRPESWRGNCERCREKNTRSRMYGYCNGKVVGLVRRMVWVGYIQWPEGTRFDSRFRTAETNRYCCELCSKTLKGVFSGRVAVVGTDAQGRPHGMFVGEDCAEKFLPGVHTRVYPNNDKKLKNENFVLEG